MTLGIIWVRKVGKRTRELIVASDSRLSGGQRWDANPKIMLLPRSDCVLSFAGSTNDAYPLMLQAWNSINMFDPARSRSLDIHDLKGRLVRVFNHSRKFISGLPRGQKKPDKPEAIFALSGFSWKTKQFLIWKLHYDEEIERFTFRPTVAWRGQKDNPEKFVSFIGDDPAIETAKSLLVANLRDNSKIDNGSFDMEPFEVLREIIRSNRFGSVGGPIQIVKIYEHANAVPVAVMWPNQAEGVPCVLGRPLMAYERTPWGVIDPDAPTRTIRQPAFKRPADTNDSVDGNENDATLTTEALIDSTSP